ncbi:MAG: VOC family protein [Pseudolysinimonas sp.]
MTSSDRLVGFVASSDLESARDFYGGVLGYELRDELPHALVATLSGLELWITKVDAGAAAPYAVLGFEADDIEARVDEVAAMGVMFLRYDGMVQDARGIWTEPGGARWAWFLDPEGNILAFTQRP